MSMDDLVGLPGIFFTGARVRLTGVGAFFADSAYAGKTGTVTKKDHLEEMYRVTLEERDESVWAYASEIEHAPEVNNISAENTKGMDKEIVIITSGMEIITVIEVSHPARSTEGFLKDWEHANETYYSNYDEDDAGDCSSDEATTRILQEQGYVINFRGYSEVVDAG